MSPYNLLHCSSWIRCGGVHSLTGLYRSEVLTFSERISHDPLIALLFAIKSLTGTTERLQ